jgi:peptidoglycan hydrolase-like protein with peptidoglycan-binding domain
VRALEERLTALRYDVSVTDGVYDKNTADAVVAFQKVAGLPRTGRVMQAGVDALATATPPGPLVPGGGPTRVEVDLPRQVLLLYQNDAWFGCFRCQRGRDGASAPTAAAGRR